MKLCINRYHPNIHQHNHCQLLNQKHTNPHSHNGHINTCTLHTHTLTRSACLCLLPWHSHVPSMLGTHPYMLCPDATNATLTSTSITKSSTNTTIITLPSTTNTTNATITMQPMPKLKQQYMVGMQSGQCLKLQMPSMLII